MISTRLMQDCLTIDRFDSSFKFNGPINAATKSCLRDY